jgi:hypothetical protein
MTGGIFSAGNDGGTFAANLPYVHTLVTNASYDGLVISARLPAQLATAPGIASATLDGDAIDVTFQDPALHPRKIAFPSYTAGHMVSAYAPAKLAADVMAFLAEP